MKCLYCDNDQFDKKRIKLPVELKGKILEVISEAFVCSKCGESQMDSEQMNNFRRVSMNAYQKKYGPLTPYTGHVEYDDKAKIFHGEVVGLKDIITFQGKSVEELEQAFHDSIEDYLEWCKERNEKPEKTFSGTFNLRIPPDLHARLALQAKSMGMSLNSFITQSLLKTAG
jgi:YgiT-type zinc finger domain-containing protein